MVCSQQLKISTFALVLSTITGFSASMHATSLDVAALFQASRGRAKIKITHQYMPVGSDTAASLATAQGKAVALYNTRLKSYYGVAIQDLKENAYVLFNEDDSHDVATVFTQETFADFLEQHTELQVRGVPGYLSNKKTEIIAGAVLVSLGIAATSAACCTEGKANETSALPLIDDQNTALKGPMSITFKNNPHVFCGALGLAAAGFGGYLLISDVLLGRYTSVTGIINAAKRAQRRQQALKS